MSGGNTKILARLEVGGNLATSGGAQIGSASSPIDRLEIVGTCAVNGPATTPGTPPCDGSHNSTYASTVGRTLDTTPQMPTVDFQGAYNAQATLTKTGCPAKLFDTDTTLNNNDSAGISGTMFGASYDCIVGANEIKWNSTARSLYVHGTLYFDGTLTGPNFDVQYTGQASMYFTGGVGFSATQFCGIANCTQAWDSSTNGIIMVAQCWQDATGTHMISPGCVNLSGGANVQFGAYVNGNYQVSGGSGNMGPILSRTFTISGGTNLLLPFNAYPAGTPTSTTTVVQPGTPPTDWSG